MPTSAHIVTTRVRNVMESWTNTIRILDVVDCVPLYADDYASTNLCTKCRPISKGLALGYVTHKLQSYNNRFEVTSTMCESVEFSGVVVTLPGCIGYMSFHMASG